MATMKSFTFLFVILAIANINTAQEAAPPPLPSQGSENQQRHSFHIHLRDQEQGPPSDPQVNGNTNAPGEVPLPPPRPPPQDNDNSQRHSFHLHLRDQEQNAPQVSQAATTPSDSENPNQKHSFHLHLRDQELNPEETLSNETRAFQIGNFTLPDFSSFLHFPGISSLPFSNFFTGSGSSTGSRRRRDTTEVANEPNATEEHDKFFFSLFSTFTSCNYTTQPGATCANCAQALYCFPSNVARLTTCHGFFPYCNNGRCSLFPATNCTSSG